MTCGPRAAQRLARGHVQESNIVTNTTDKITPVPTCPLVQAPVLNISVANWLALHGFGYQPARVLHRGAYIWYWRISRNSDPHRPRKTVDVPLYLSDLKGMQVYVRRAWPDVI